MYMYPNFGDNIPCGSRVISIFTNRPRTDSHSDYSAHQSVVQLGLLFSNTKVINKQFLVSRRKNDIATSVTCALSKQHC